MQSYKVKVDTAKLTRAFKSAPVETAKELKKGTAKACQAVVMTSSNVHKYIARTGQAERAVMYRVNNTGTTGTVYINEAIAPHALYLHEGTGLYGSKGKEYTVKPKTRKALYWVNNGGKFFSGGHKVKGIRPDRFINRSLQLEQDNIGKIMTAAVRKALAKVGLK